VTVTVAVHRVQHADVVDDSRQPGEQFAHPQATLAMLGELVAGLDEVPLELPRLVQPPRGGDFLAVVGDQLGLVVERVDVRRAAGGEQEDHPVGLRGKVRLMRRQRVGRPPRVLGEQPGQCQGAESSRGPLQKLAA
jgi:hypothetical protein